MGIIERTTILWVFVVVYAAVSSVVANHHKRVLKRQVVYQDSSLNSQNLTHAPLADSLRNLVKAQQTLAPTPPYISSHSAYPGDVASFLKLSREATQSDLVKDEQKNGKVSQTTNYSGLPHTPPGGQKSERGATRESAGRYYPLSSYDDLVSPQNSPTSGSAWLVPASHRTTRSINAYVLPGFSAPFDAFEKRSDINAELTVEGAGFLLSESNPITSSQDSSASSGSSSVIYSSQVLDHEMLKKYESPASMSLYGAASEPDRQTVSKSATTQNSGSKVKENDSAIHSSHPTPTVSSQSIQNNIIPQIPAYHPPAKLPNPISISVHLPPPTTHKIVNHPQEHLLNNNNHAINNISPQQQFARKPLLSKTGPLPPPAPPNKIPVPQAQLSIPAPYTQPSNSHSHPQSNIPPPRAQPNIQTPAAQSTSHFFQVNRKPPTQYTTTHVTAHLFSPSSSNAHQVAQTSFHLPIYNIPPIGHFISQAHRRPTRSVDLYEPESSELSPQEDRNDTHRDDFLTQEETRLFPISGHFDEREFPFFSFDEGPRPHSSRRFPHHGPRYRSSSRRDRGPVYHASEARRHSHGMLGSGNFEIIKGGIYPEEEASNNHASYLQSGSGVYDSNPGVYFDEGLFGNNPVLGFQGFSNFGSLYNTLSSEKKVTTTSPLEQDSPGRSASQLIPLTVELQAVP